MDKNEIKEKIVQMLAEAQKSYNISFQQDSTYRALESRIKALEDVLDLFD